MMDYKMKLIDRYFDTTGVSLDEETRELLCLVLGNADRYNGYTSETYIECRREEEKIVGAEFRRYRILFDAPNRMRIACIRKYEGEDGSVQDTHWDWANAESGGYEIRRVLEDLTVFDWELR